MLALLSALVAVYSFVIGISYVKANGAKQLLHDLFTRKNIVGLLLGALAVVIASLIQLLITWFTTGKP